ncbi:dTDP-4-amino-4,6-dideoxygalactose transaminase [Serratia marcescens]|uniref:dTDP-4-amino-4,6-dideoxygalactose transaminase n=1 Tax=Serratia marcescens TaxID=615 RepID=UPI0006ED4258|nr:dTDP-4-amino-4,6-dideoxygalactose transaminase [Serratia marcescens]ALL36344.1 dTDP-4-amino-4,6-dideoxy-D-glucose transaminase [Serratia marcescens]MDV5741700.1 dTDP-4-amino-4,6-dideoxygalactose transaminase [Serratia marcescens]MDV5746611.1 dTDP-4-amino-4,6-dideoxygalactose transaminase [Serratia marcescens]MDV5778047.1 dTDP-4-amino-4,6-dideoxygalactose transaminase [Serratia marcescens]MDV5782990.1 dTDP-4-amino-4,6-dideoxygalactose transaminase [Serratia marcescens]
MIPFNKPPVTGNEIQYINAALENGKLSGDGPFGKQCQKWFENKLGCKHALLTPSCTAALEIAALLVDIQPGDEVIMPSYTFVSTANAFVLRGAKIKFVDIHPETMNMDAALVAAAITDKTKAIVPVHYAGVSCDMDAIMRLADQHNLLVVEDAAQGVMSKYKGDFVGVKGHLAAFSFHETKNYTSGGEGGALVINDERFIKRAEILREKGTDRSQFLRGQVDKYTWVDFGSSFLPGELQSACLWGQLELADEINDNRLATWHKYYVSFAPLAEKGLLTLPTIPADCEHNAHMFYVKLKDIEQRTQFIAHLKACGVMAVFHYIPLHSAPAGKVFGTFIGEDNYTTRESERLVRLPLYYKMTDADQNKVIESVVRFFE